MDTATTSSPTNGPDATKNPRLQTFSMPDVGEGLTEAEVLGWRVGVGDQLEVNQVIVEIETAKAAVELPSPYAGRVHELLVEPGVTVSVGTPIITIDTDPGAGPAPGDGAGWAGAGSPGGAGSVGGDAGPASAKIGDMTADGRIATLVGYVAAGKPGTRRPRRVPATASVHVQAPTAAVPVQAHPEPAVRAHRVPLATPPVRKLAKDLGIDLTTVTATRTDGVISREDVERASAATPVAATARPPAAGTPPAEREHRIPVHGVRKATAAAMVTSAFSAPHVTEFLTVDITPTMQLRDRLRDRPDFAQVKLTPLAFVARAVCIAIRRTPEINSVFETAVTAETAAAGAGAAGGSEPAGDHILIKDYVNLGIAAATPRGLLVPVVHDADRMDLAGLARALQDLTETARSGHTGLAQLSGGTFTITNVGVFGVDTGTPIINPGEAAILAVGRVKDAPWVVDGQLAVRQVCQLALSFDHRVVDGQQGSAFLSDVGTLLSDPGTALAF